MRQLVTSAVVVRLVEYGEADRVATLLTSTMGKVAVLARGARRSRRRFVGLTLFACGEARLVEGRGELWRLDDFEVAIGFPHLSLDVARVAHAAYVCELLRELAPPHQAEPGLFDLLLRMLRLLDGDGASATRLRWFEIQLLGRLGLAPAVDRCPLCGGLPGERFHLPSGGLLCQECAHGHPDGRPLSPSLRAALAVAQDGPVEAFVLEETDRDAARELLQELLRPHLPRPLRSLEFIGKLNRAGRAAG